MKPGWKQKKTVAASLKTKLNALERFKGKLLKKKKKVCSTSVWLGGHLQKYKNTALSDFLRKFKFFAPV